MSVLECISEMFWPVLCTNFHWHFLPLRVRPTVTNFDIWVEAPCGKKVQQTVFLKKKKPPLSFDKSIKYTLRLCAGRTQPAQSTCFAGVEVVRVEAVLLFLIQGGQSGNGVLLPNICCKSHIFMAGLKPLLFPQLLLHRTRMLVIRLTAEFLHAFIAHQKRK